MPCRKNGHFLAFHEAAALYAPGIAPVIMQLLRLRTDHVLDLETGLVTLGSGNHRHVLEIAQQRWTIVPAHVGRAVNDIITSQCGDREIGHPGESESLGHPGIVYDDVIVHILAPSHEVHLVYRDKHVRHP